MYSYEDRSQAFQLNIKLGKRARLTIRQLANALRAKQSVSITFTLPQMDRPVTLKVKERTEELNFIEDFLKSKPDRCKEGSKGLKTLSSRRSGTKSVRSISWSRASVRLPGVKSFNFYKTKAISGGIRLMGG